MLAPANYYFLYQELCLFVWLQGPKKLHSAPLKTVSLKFPVWKDIIIIYNAKQVYQGLLKHFNTNGIWHSTALATHFYYYYKSQQLF